MFNIMNKKLGRKGFTLIELIVVIAIIAILAVILIPRFTGFTEGANKKSAMSDTRNLLIAAQAMVMQGQKTIATTAAATRTATNDDFVKYGIDYKGTVSNGTTTNASKTLVDGYFTYTLNKGTVAAPKDYVIEVDNWVITYEKGPSDTAFSPVG